MTDRLLSVFRIIKSDERTLFKNLSLFLSVVTLFFIQVATVFAEHETMQGNEHEVEELNKFLGAIIVSPHGAEEWVACLFWFVIITIIGYMIGALSVVAVSSEGTAQRIIYFRQLVVFVVESLVVAGVSFYLHFMCIALLFAVLAGILSVGLVWFSIRNMKR